MKKILFILLSAFVLGSCDFLDEESKTQIPLDNYFNNEEEAMLFLYGAYYQVRNTVFGLHVPHRHDDRQHRLFLDQR